MDYFLNETIRVFIVDINNEFYFSVEGCFSNYDNNIKFAYDILKKAHSKYGIKFDVFGEIFLFEDIKTYEDFEKIIKHSHKRKYNNFVKHYGKMDVPLLPDGAFYKYIQKHVNPWWKNLW